MAALPLAVERILERPGWWTLRRFLGGVDYSDARDTAEEGSTEGMGESFDFDDDRQMRRRLPRPAALYLGPESG